MKVEKTIDLGKGHKIEFGKATWGDNEISIRNRYPTSTGGFSPRSSSEIPIQDIEQLVVKSIENDYLNTNVIQNIQDSCKHKLKIRKPSLFHRFIRKSEAIGLILLLLSFGWQLFEQETYSIVQETNLYQTHEKLDAIWEVLADDYSKKYQNEITSHSSTNFENHLNTWKYWGKMNREKEFVTNQFNVATNIRIVLYIIGSLLLIIPKLLTEENNNA